MTLSVNGAFYQGLRYRQDSRNAASANDASLDAQGSQFDPPPTPKVVSDQEASQLRPWTAPPTPVLGQNADTAEAGQRAAAPPTPTPGVNGAATERKEPTTALPTPVLGQNRDTADNLGPWIKGAPPTPTVGQNGANTESLSQLFANILNTPSLG